MRVDAGTWAKWRKWMEMVEADLGSLVDDQGMFDAFLEIVRENEKWIESHQGGLFIDLVRRSYSANAFMAIRRQLKVKKDAVSLARLLTEMAENARQITYEFYVAVLPPRGFPWDSAPAEWHRDVFAKLSDDGRSVSAELIGRDLARAAWVNDRIEEVADRIFAHLDPRGTQASVTFDELRVAVNNFDELAAKYILFLTGAQYAHDSLAARVLSDWTQVFRHPFVKPNGA